MSGDRPFLRALAERAGILPSYVDVGGAVREASDRTREELLAALGIEAASEAAAAASLRDLRRLERDRLLPPVTVVRRDALGGGLVATLPPGAEGRARCFAEIREESGLRRTLEGQAEVHPGSGRLRLPLPPELAPGYHSLRLEARLDAGSVHGEQSLIVTPDSCFTPWERVGDRRVFGLLLNLYAARSARSWGIGDLSDLGALARWAGGMGAAFVGINPLHALRNRGVEISPYGPVSRLYRSFLYLDIEAVPELAGSPEAAARLRSPRCRGALAACRASGRVAYEEIRELKEEILRPLHRTFEAQQRSGETERGRAYARFRAEQGEALTDFATFLALEESFAAAGGSRFWQEWPEPFRDPRSRQVAEFRDAHREEIEFHCWVQFEIDRQLGACSDTATGAGLPLGIYADLALGTSAGGCDAWAFPGLFRFAASLGAPPDAYAPEGQDWGLPPVDPRRLRDDRYRYWIALVRTGLAHAGGLRIDHVMGLLRQFWIPAGRGGADGAYVRFPAEDLLGILALESRRREAIVIGEDLGTVPDGFAGLLERWGVLSCRVLRFERGGDGGFNPSGWYPERALVSASTHDLPPLAGFWRGRDLEIRREAGLLRGEAEVRQAEEERERERGALLERLRQEGALPEGREPATDADRCAAVHIFLSRTPSKLLGVFLDDLAGETEPVNVPGLGNDRYPNWTRPLGETLEELADDPGVRRGLEGLRERGARV